VTSSDSVLRSSADAYRDIAEARPTRGACPQPDGAICIWHVFNRIDRLAVDARRHRRLRDGKLQGMPLVGVRPDQLLAEVASLAVHKLVQSEHVVQGVLLEQVEVVGVANAKRDTRVHLAALRDGGPLLK